MYQEYTVAEVEAADAEGRRLPIPRMCPVCGRSGTLLVKVKCVDDDGIGSMMVCAACKDRSDVGEPLVSRMVDRGPSLSPMPEGEQGLMAAAIKEPLPSIPQRVRIFFGL